MALLTALGALLGFLVVYLFAVWTGPGQWLDAQGFGRSDRVVPDFAERWFPWIVRAILPVLLGILLGFLGGVALVRRTWRPPATAVMVVAVSVPMAWYLKTHLLWVPDGADARRIYEQSTYPSVHVVAVTSLVVAVLLLWPRSCSALPVIGGGVLVAMTCLGNVSGLAHVPSDVIGAVLLVIAVAASSVALVHPDSAAR